MKKIYSAPTVEVCVFNNSDGTNAQLLVSGNFSVTRASGVGSGKYRDMFDF